MVVVLTFGLIVALCTSFMVKLTTGAIGMAQGAISSKKTVDQPKTTGKPLKILTRIYHICTWKNERSWKVRNVTGKNQVGKFESKLENFLLLNTALKIF